MADPRIPSSPPTPVRAQPVARPEAVRAAQRAFFDAALAGAPAPAAVRAEAPAPPVVATTPVKPVEPPGYGRLLRPGSLLDIKV